MIIPRGLSIVLLFILFALSGAEVAHPTQSRAVYLPSIHGSRVPHLEQVAPLAGISDVTAAGGRLYAAALDGLVYRIDPTSRAAPEIVLDIRDRVEIEDAEQGLLGLALHPQFAANGYLYVYYTAVSVAADAPAVLSRFTAAPGGAADPASEQVLLTIPHLMSLHYGGALHFGPDGTLFVASGDGYAAPPGQWPNPPNAQNGDNLLGKILRLDVDTEDGRPYAIPPDNPFAADDGVRNEIWLLGLRNPWRFSFDRLTGDLYLGDVGWNASEEIDVVPAGVGGLNMGWPCYEGHELGPARHGCGPAADYHFPAHVYDHDGRCAIIGGYVYRGRAVPWLVGRYLFADICSGEIWTLWGSGASQQVDSLGIYPNRQWATFGQDESGELYVAGLGVEPGIYRFVP